MACRRPAIGYWPCLHAAAHMQFECCNKGQTQMYKVFACCHMTAGCSLVLFLIDISILQVFRLAPTA